MADRKVGLDRVVDLLSEAGYVFNEGERAGIRTWLARAVRAGIRFYEIPDVARIRSGTALMDLTPGFGNRIEIAHRRKDDDTGWWVKGGGGLADEVIERSWLVLTPDRLKTIAAQHRPDADV